MRQPIGTRKSPGEKIVKDIKRATRKQYSSEAKIRIVLDGRPAQYSYTHYFRHAPARLRIDANLFDLARGYAAVCLPLVRYRRNRGWVWGFDGCVRLQERHRYSRTNFKLNRAAALAEWRQLLSA